MEDYLRANRDNWDELVAIHEKSKYYDLDGFKSGKSSLKSIELEELGNVSGKSLLHLQCHFGLDTLSWARLGAKVTGVDFSDKAIALARSLSKELGIEAAFVCSDVYDLPKAHSGKFDIVFTSYGVLCWLPDIGRWARVVSQFIEQGGTFFIVEHHPFVNVFYGEADAVDLRATSAYFHSQEPLMEAPGTGTYADPAAEIHTPEYEWVHSLGDIVNSLVSSGLKIEYLHEFPFTDYRAFPFLEQRADGWWSLKQGKAQIPLLFSLKATK